MNADIKEFDEGFIVEHEHMPTYNFIDAYLKRTGDIPSSTLFFELIVRDHLKEHAAYYSRLREAGL